MKMIIVLVIAIIILQYKLWLGDDSILHWIKLEKKLKIQIQVNQELLALNRKLAKNIWELKIDEQALEEFARYELGMIKKDEVYYQFVN